MSPPAELAAIALLGREHAFDRGAVVCQSGARLDRVHIVVDGHVRVRGGEHGDEVVGPEQTIGLLSLLARDDDGLDAVAEADTVTLALRADDLFDVFEDDFRYPLRPATRSGRAAAEAASTHSGRDVSGPRAERR